MEGSSRIQPPGLVLTAYLTRTKMQAMNKDKKNQEVPCYILQSAPKFALQKRITLNTFALLPVDEFIPTRAARSKIILNKCPHFRMTTTEHANRCSTPALFWLFELRTPYLSSGYLSYYREMLTIRSASVLPFQA